MKLSSSFAMAIMFGALSVAAQGNFQNLDFETENIPPGTPPVSTVSIPGWTASLDVVYDAQSYGGAAVTVQDSQTPIIGFLPIQGNYSVVLFGGPEGGPGGSSSISQTGFVPANAKSILMDISHPVGYSGSFTVTLGNQQIAMSPYQTFSTYTVYAGNISTEANQNETLTITQYAPAAGDVPPSSLALDNIIFSPNPVPEPATWTLLLCGAGLLAVTRHRRKP